MGTKFLQEDGLYIKRFFGGKDRGVCYSVRIDREFTKKELILVMKALLEGLDIWPITLFGKLSYASRRMLALGKGKPNIDDFGNELKTLTIYNVSRNLIIGCNENNLSYYLRHINDNWYRM